MPVSDQVVPSSLIELLRKNIISAIGTATAPEKWRVVVADRPALKIVSSVLKMHSVLEQNVMAIQLLTRSRQPYPDIDAVYIIVPCADSISRVISDFKVDLNTGEVIHRQYARAHLFFTGALSDALLDHLRSSSAAPFIKAATELYIEYNPIESRVFLTTPSDQPFYALYSPHALDTVGKDLDAAADRLLSVVVSLNIRPYIRYYKPSASAPYAASQSLLLPGSEKAETLCPRIAESMAALIQGKLNDYYSHEQSNSEGRENYVDTLDPSVIIVVDRSIDLYAPLLHEFTYQALVHDLVDLERGNKYVYDVETSDGQLQTSEAELSEQKDVIWKKCRHRHIGIVSQSLADQFEKLLKENIGVQATQQAGRKLTLHEMKAVLSELPEFKQLQKSYSLHIDLASKCLEIINRNSLAIVADFEQAITGRTATGEYVDRTYLETRLISFLDDNELAESDRIRLLFLYLEDEDAQETPSLAGRYQWDAVSEPRDGQLRPRLEPAIKCIVNEQVGNTLDTELFPWAEEAPPESIPKHVLNINATSLRRNKSSWRRSKQILPKRNDKKRGVIIVYIAGGVTLSEMRAIYELSETLKRDIYIGSTHIITPRGFLDDMKSLHLKMLT
ncbi:syntaxin binding protein 1 [Coemansia brasiliensis]|uniref:Syntaxin binding protein 1 n=1 Tax=Coemansia brasiliensis TaxID=2650707 RepID=A0A9W8I7M0_9FUNG|nr:syntaxin binding protein 1 [Coemansia brasiliensis]